MFNSKNEKHALLLFWIQLVAIAAVAAIFFKSFLLFGCLIGFAIILAYYAFNFFMPNLYLIHLLTILWMSVTSLYSVSIALYMDGTFLALLLMASAGLISHTVNFRLARLWMGTLF